MYAASAASKTVIRQYTEELNKSFPFQNGRFQVCDVLESPSTTEIVHFEGAKAVHNRGDEIAYINGKLQLAGWPFGWNTIEKVQITFNRKSMQVTNVSPWYR
jgi:hypothetical protein